MSDFEERISRLNEMIAKSKYIVFFGGAGVSTESGIPDFRSKNGLYNTLDVKFEKHCSLKGAEEVLRAFEEHEW